jgi:hypothetical protein
LCLLSAIIFCSRVFFFLGIIMPRLHY